MAKQTEVIISMGDLKESLDKMALETKKELAHTFTDEVKKEAKLSMEEFERYRPKKYLRHGKKGFMHKSYYSIYKNPHNKNIIGGIKISAEKINPDNYFTLKKVGKKYKRVKVGTSTAIPSNSLEVENVTMGHILDLVYSGHHGNVEVFNNAARETYGSDAKIVKQPPDMTPSPYERIYKVREDFLERINKNGYVNMIASKHWK